MTASPDGSLFLMLVTVKGQPLDYGDHGGQLFTLHLASITDFC